jgi:hypothetical protein
VSSLCGSAHQFTWQGSHAAVVTLNPTWQHVQNREGGCHEGCPEHPLPAQQLVRV